METDLKLRPARLADAEILLRWRNDEATRRWSRNQSEVAMEEHQRWLASALANPFRRLWIAVREGAPVGVIRADAREGGVELSWTVAPEARGQGVGRRMVSAAVRTESGRIWAEIREGNEASIAIARRVGFRQVDTKPDGFLVFAWDGTDRIGEDGRRSLDS